MSSELPVAEILANLRAAWVPPYRTKPLSSSTPPRPLRSLSPPRGREKEGLEGPQKPTEHPNTRYSLSEISGKTVRRVHLHPPLLRREAL